MFKRSDGIRAPQASNRPSHVSLAKSADCVLKNTGVLASDSLRWYPAHLSEVPQYCLAVHVTCENFDCNTAPGDGSVAAELCCRIASQIQVTVSCSFSKEPFAIAPLNPKERSWDSPASCRRQQGCRMLLRFGKPSVKRCSIGLISLMRSSNCRLQGVCPCCLVYHRTLYRAWCMLFCLPLRHNELACAQRAFQFRSVAECFYVGPIYERNVCSGTAFAMRSWKCPPLPFARKPTRSCSRRQKSVSAKC